MYKKLSFCPCLGNNLGNKIALYTVKITVFICASMKSSGKCV